MKSPPIPAGHRAESRAQPEGVALVLVLIFSILLYVLVAELVVTARMARLTGENDALLSSMRNHMEYTLLQIEEQLMDDLAAAADEEGMPGEPGGAGAGLPGMGGAGGEEGGMQDESLNVDSSRDAWFEPAGYAEGDITTYVWVEDENRKFNLLSLVSQDDEFARESQARFVRLIDAMREGTAFDLTSADGETLLGHLLAWMRGSGRTEEMPVPPLKTDDEEGISDVTIPMHLEELMLLEGVGEDLYFDRVLDGMLIPGLESVLTIRTSLRIDRGDPNKRPEERENAEGESAPSPDPEAEEAAAAMMPVLGDGIRINVNTASRAVLRCLLPPSEIPDSVIEAILRYRNEVDEGEQMAGELSPTAESDYFGELDPGDSPKKKIFSSLDTLDEIPEFRNIADPQARQKFLDMLSVNSHVFSVHMAALYKRDEERRNFVIRRTRSVLVRTDESGEPMLVPIIRMEERTGLRVAPVDFPEQYDEFAFESALSDMDRYSREERRWNPFFLEFYRPPER